MSDLIGLQVWKKEFSPCEGELAALRRGEEWDPVKDKLEREEREWREKLEVERSRTLNKVNLIRIIFVEYVNLNFFRLYRRIIIKINTNI